jgi:uncharacterized protein DUF5677
VHPIRKTVDFEFGGTRASAAFFARRPKFHAAFRRIVQLSNSSFGDRSISSRLMDVCNRLGIASRDDFLDITFNVVNGHGAAATKLLRGMYERAVTLAYLLKHPEKVDSFIRYAAINEHKMVQEARKFVGDAELDAVLRENSIKATQRNYEKYKVEFLKPDGKKVRPSWDIDFASQVRNVGSPFEEYYLAAYLLPTNHVHATLTSIMRPEERQPAEVQADITLMMAHVLFTKVIELHGCLFGLSLEADLQQCSEDFADLWLTNRLPEPLTTTRGGPAA